MVKPCRQHPAFFESISLIFLIVYVRGGRALWQWQLEMQVSMEGGAERQVEVIPPVEINWCDARLGMGGGELYERGGEGARAGARSGRGFEMS